MRCNPWRWLWGIIPILMLSWVAFHMQRPPIEGDLTSRSQRTLDDAGFDWAEVKFSGRDAVVSGKAPDEGTPRKAIQAVRSIWGVRVVRARTDLIEKVDAYSWSAAVRDDRVTTAGFVPDNDSRQSILRVIKTNFPRFEIDDDMQLARGVPDRDQWMSQIGFALKQLRSLRRGRALLTEDGLHLSGEALDFASFKTVAGQLAGELPHGLRQAKNEITPPVVDPFTWQAVLSDQQLVLEGYVPRESLREDLFSRAKAAFPKLAVVDRMNAAGGAPRSWEQAAFLALQQLALTNKGRAELVGRDLVFAGEARTEAGARTIRSALKAGLPETYKLVDDITFPKPVYPVASPYVTTIDFNNNRLELSGSAPSPEARQTLVDRAKAAFPDAEVRNSLSLASGQSQGWQPCVLAGLVGLQKFSSGRIQLVGRRMELKAETRNEQIFSAVPGELKAATNRACDAEARIELILPEEPDLTWRAAHDDGKVLLLEGEVPSAAAKAELVNVAGALYSGSSLVDRMEIIESPAGNWMKVARLGLTMLAKLRSGEVVLHDQNLLVRGEAADTATATTIRTGLERDIAKGYDGRDRLTVRSNAMIWAEEEARRRNLEAQKQAEEESRRLAAAEAARREAEAEAERQQAAAEAAEQRRREAEEALRLRREKEARKRQVEDERIRRAEAVVAAQQCESELTAAATQGVILFDFARATLKRQSRPTLDRLADLVKGCASGLVEISGHTDDDGSDDFNMKLSQERAESVMEYLADAGVASTRMRATGYGETRPVAPNTTANNKAKNRRIEFRVLIE